MPPFASSNQSAVVCWWFGDAAGVVVGTSHGRACFSYQRTHCGDVAANESPVWQGAGRRRGLCPPMATHGLKRSWPMAGTCCSDDLNRRQYRVSCPTRLRLYFLSAARHNGPCCSTMPASQRRHRSCLRRNAGKASPARGQSTLYAPDRGLRVCIRCCNRTGLQPCRSTSCSWIAGRGDS